MTVPDFIESTIAGILATHHPYHWMIIAVKWVYLHLIVAMWAILLRMFWK